MDFIHKLAEVVKRMDPDELFSMYKDPSLSKDDIGQLFVAYATFSNPKVGKIVLNVPEIPKTFPEKAEAACYDILKTKKLDINEPIIVNGQTNYPLQLAVTLGTPKLVEMVLNYGADPNIKVDGYPLVLSLLSFASEKTLPMMYKMAFGFEPDAADVKQIANSYKEIIKILINHGADTNVYDPNSKMTFTQLAEELHLDDIVKLANKKKGLSK